MHIPDEMLMAYADDELSPRERADLEARLQTDTALRRRLEPFVATGGPSLSGFFDAPLDEPVPARLLRAVASTPVAEPRARGTRSASTGFGWLETIGGFLFPKSPGLATAFSLAALLMGAGGAGWLVGHETAGPPPSNGLVAVSSGELVAAGPLLAALEAKPSQTLAADVTPSSIVPLQSFRNHAGAYCREYRAGTGDGKMLSGVACRQAEGAWEIAAHVETQRAGGASGAAGYETASGPAAEALNAVVDSLIVGDVLGADDEAAIIARQWAPAAR